jgi:hypothetical protein
MEISDLEEKKEKRRKEREKERRKNHYPDLSYFDSPTLARSLDFKFHLCAERAYLYS